MKIPLYIDGSKHTSLSSNAVIPGWLAREVPAPVPPAPGAGNLEFAEEAKEVDIAHLLDEDSTSPVMLKFKVPSLVPKESFLKRELTFGEDDVIELKRDAGSFPGEEEAGAKKSKKTRAAKQASQVRMLSDIFGPDAAVQALKLNVAGAAGFQTRVPKRGKAPPEVAHLLS